MKLWSVAAGFLFAITLHCSAEPFSFGGNLPEFVPKYTSPVLLPHQKTLPGPQHFDLAAPDPSPASVPATTAPALPQRAIPHDQRNDSALLLA